MNNLLSGREGPTAEGEGFEPSSEESPPKRFSRPPHSTALPPLRGDPPRLEDLRAARDRWSAARGSRQAPASVAPRLEERVRV